MQDLHLRSLDNTESHNHSSELHAAYTGLVTNRSFVKTGCNNLNSSEFTEKKKRGQRRIPVYGVPIEGHHLSWFLQC